MIVRLLRPFVQRVVIANPLQVRLIAQAEVKTDKIDAAVLAKLHASRFLPEVWTEDEATETLRRLVAQRSQVVQQMTRIKKRIHGVLHAHLIPPYEAGLFSTTGRSRRDREHGGADVQGVHHAKRRSHVQCGRPGMPSACSRSAASAERR